MSRGQMRLPVFLSLLGLAWLLVVGQLIAQYWASTAITMPDADDAMRLVEMRKFIADGFLSWFDLHEPRLGLAPGYDTHWSRLVDFGLAGAFLLFRIFTDNALAERLMLAIWPLLWLIPVIGGAAAIACRLAGWQAAILVLLLAVFPGPGIQQFRPGRIDHHNVQIALSILVIAATVWSDRVRWYAAAAGALTGLALAVGFETLLFLIVCGAAFAFRFVFNASARRELRDYGFALAASAVAAFLISIPPDRWMASACDAIAVNSSAAVIVTGLGLAVIASLSGNFTRMARLGLAAAPAILAVAIFALIEPRCLGGHFVFVDPAVRPIWLDNVSEMQSLFALIRQAPTTGLATLAFPLAALAAALMMAREKNLYRAFGPLIALAGFVTAMVYMLVVVRASSYAIWLGMPFVAAALWQFFTRMKIDNLALRFAAALLVTPTALTLGAIAFASAAGQSELTDLNPPERAGCTAKQNYRALAALPPGLMAINDLDFGPYMLAWTPHSALAAPYHRLSSSIVLSHRIFTQPPEAARRLVAQAGAAYIVTCGQRGDAGLSDQDRRLSLFAALQSGRAPDWLEPVPQDPASGFKVWRVKR